MCAMVIVPARNNNLTTTVYIPAQQSSSQHLIIPASEYKLSSNLHIVKTVSLWATQFVISKLLWLNEHCFVLFMETVQC